MFRHPAWAVGSYSSGPPAANTVGTKSTGGFHQRHGSPCIQKALNLTIQIKSSLPGKGGVHGDADGLHLVSVDLRQVEGLREVAFGGHLGERGAGDRGVCRVLLLPLEQRLALVASEIKRVGFES